MVLSQISETVKIFFSLATSDDDRNWFDKLYRHLSVQRRQGLIEVLYDSLICPGNDADDSIKTYIRDADIIVLLMSADFFDSDQCVDVEMRYALEQHAVRAAYIIPVLLRPIDWESYPLERSHLLPPDGRALSDWANQDNALVAVAKGIHRVVDEIAHRLVNAPIEVPPAQFPLWTLPYRKNPFFTDRKEILTDLHRSFTSGQSIQIRAQLLHGLSGMGKTIIAMEYARRNRHEYQAILWINAASPEILSANVISLTAQLGIPAQDSGDEQQRFAAIRHWLQQHEKWLAVLDNLEDFALINQLIPLQGSGHVLLITRTQVPEEIASTIPVTQMTIEEGALLLLRRANIIPEQGSHIAAPEVDFLQATVIAQEVEGYPLALDLAGAYIQETQQTLASYLKLYHQHQRQARLSNIQGWFAKKHPDAITTTLTLTLKKIAQIDPNALELLRFFAFLHPEALPDEMLVHGASSLTGSLNTIASDSLILKNALDTLQKFSLIHSHADSTTLNIHTIVQAAIRKDLTKKQQEQLANQAVRLINFIFPEVLFTTWKECERYAPQAQHCSALIHNLHLTLEDGGLLLERLGFYYYQRGCYTEANTYLTQALRLQERNPQSDPSDIAQTLNSLGLLAQRQARYQDAKVLHQRALELREQVPDHPQLAESLHNLAVLYEHDEQYAQAEQLYLRVLSLDERTSEPDDPETAKTLNNLALIYYLQGHYSQAETTYQRALTIYEHSPSPNHPDLSYTLNGLGALAEKRGDDQQAAELYQRAMSIREETLGKEHSETAHSISRLAHIAELRGDYQQAKVLYEQALSISEKKLGPEHSDVALFLNNLALLASKQGQYQQAEPLYQRALGIYELLPGTERPAVARVLNNLGQLYHKIRNEGQAEALLQQALAMREQVHGMTHPDTAQSLSSLADLLVDQHRYEEAEPLLQRALAILQQTFDPAHPDVTRVREKYASVLEYMNRNEEAAQLRQAASGQEEHTGL